MRFEVVGIFQKGQEMPSPGKEHAKSRCRQERHLPENHRRSRWAAWILPASGLLALMWFVFRVIPKPSRAAYPCQRAAFPLASGFVIWLAGALGSLTCMRRAKRCLAQSRYVLAALLVAISVGSVWFA
jgi:hypothetical protein